MYLNKYINSNVIYVYIYIWIYTNLYVYFLCIFSGIQLKTWHERLLEESALDFGKGGPTPSSGPLLSLIAFHSTRTRVKRPFQSTECLLKSILAGIEPKEWFSFQGDTIDGNVCFMCLGLEDLLKEPQQFHVEILHWYGHERSHKEINGKEHGSIFLHFYIFFACVCCLQSICWKWFRPKQLKPYLLFWLICAFNHFFERRKSASKSI